MSTTGVGPVWAERADLVVVGSGVAGLTAALGAHEHGLRVLVLAKATVDDSATAWAQGGIAVVGPEAIAAGDSVAAHVRDTLTAGVGLCDEAAVRSIIAGGGDAVTRLVARGARFDTDTHGRLARTREGGHCCRRVVHAGGDATGAEVQRALHAEVGGHPADPVRVLGHHTATRVLLGVDGSVHGLAVLDAAGRSGVVHAPAVLLATGGLGHLYTSTTNPDVATGDGIALALGAGAAVSDLEFVQFHPTVLYTPDGAGQRPLVTEAVRGEGAVLTDLAGHPVMAGLHPLGDLAPRDVVAAAVTARMRATGTDHVLLDARRVDGFATRFPTVHAACAAVGVDPGTQPIPVLPAAHYSCGGVVTDTAGATGVPGLYAAGEVARTGLHGANRLASNSLLEGLVVGERVVRLAATRVLEVGAVHARSEADVAQQRVLPRGVLQELMSVHAGLQRDAEGLRVLADALAGAPLRDVVDRRTAEDAALTLVATALVSAAAARTETRGCHLRQDHPRTERPGSSTALRLDPGGRPRLEEKVGTAA